MLYPLVAALILAVGTAPEDSRRLFGFERSEIEGLASRLDTDTKAAYQIHHGFGGRTGDVTEGQWALFRTIGDRYGFLRPGNTTTYYIRHRTGCILNVRRGKVFPADWSAFDALRVDIKSETVDLKLRLELEDEYIPDPVTRQYEVPAGKWTTIEADLRQAAKERGLDLTKMAALRLIVTELGERLKTAVVRLDNLRLVKAGAKNGLPLLTDLSPMKPPERKPGPVNPLDPFDVTVSQAADGKVGLIDFSTHPRWRKPSYPLLKVKERLLGGFGTGGVIVVRGANRAYLSLDGGVTWQGLGGKPGATPLSGSIRGHRATVLVDGRDIYVATIPHHCAGGGGRTEILANRCLYRDGRWTVGPQVVFETGVRHCADRLSLAKLKSGRLWVAWDHLGRLGRYSIRAKYSDDEGLTWQDAGKNGLVGTPGGGIPSGPYLTEWGDGVACVWRHRQTMWWAEFDGKAWLPAVAVRRTSVPYSVVTVDKEAYVAIHRPDAVLRYDGKAWAEDSPPIRTGLLSRCGETLVCVGTVKGEKGTDIVMCRKPPGGRWSEAQTVATETEQVQGVAVPQIAPANDEGAFVPVAWSSVSRRWLKVVAVPMKNR